ncbi:choline/carnitine/betaine transport [Melghirimyces profundicolus]|uniref:Choline/carnitine/betaine transport n=1 Tax=Melghirimyces profundicolus TaxID=1242148 RepID=A0A2T6BW84_9BACL|nr:BCCT family transporter [Melghirimyces profundicolus]PTX60344.1 choline/carnitine/betaine transport [Melghirimyces profundicolus]
MNEKKIRWSVFAPIALLMAGTVLIGILNPNGFYNLQTGIVDYAFANFGWLFNWTALSLIFICLYLAFSKYGKIKFGGVNAKPTINKWEWFAISLTAGIGTGILFWGTAEPITHFSVPPEELGIKPGTEEAAVFSIAAVLQQWTLAPYAIYVICGIAVAYAHYNIQLPYSISSTLYPVLGKRSFGLAGTVVDGLCMFSIIGASAAVLGEGVLQIGSGIGHLTNLNTGPILWALLVVAITVTYILSSYTGLQKGIRILADYNTKLFFFLMVFVFIFGPTVFILNLGTQATGSFLSSIPERFLWMSPMDGSEWPKSWPIFEWSLWMAYAPMIGMFLARLAYGRTLREFVTMNLLLPAGFGAIWFWSFGGSAIYYDWKGGGKLWDLINSEGGLELSLFAFLEHFPLPSLISWLLLIAVYISFTTLADSLTTTVSSLTTTSNTILDPEPPAKVKVFWGAVMGLMALLTITAGTGGEITGIDAVKQMATVSGFPILFFMILLIFSTIKGLMKQKMFDRANFPETTKVDMEPEPTDRISGHY